MTPLIRTAFAGVLSLAAFDAFAKIDAKASDKCILTLEARAIPAPDAPVPRAPCPIAVGYGASGSSRLPAMPALRSRPAVPFGIGRGASVRRADDRFDRSGPALNV